MEEKPVENQVDEELIDAGEEIFAWETWEFPPQTRSTFWYAVATILGVTLIVYAIWTANFMFAIIILMIGIIFLAGNLRKPHRIEIHITTLGVVVGHTFYSYDEIKDFSIVYAPPEIKWLYIDFKKVWLPLLSIPLEDADPNAVREALVPYAFENIEREEETLTDLLRRMYKM